MIEAFEGIVGRLVGPARVGSVLPLLDPEPLLAADDEVAELSAAFLVALCGTRHPAYTRAMAALDRPIQGSERDLARFLLAGVDLVRDEVRRVAEADPMIAARLASVAARLDDPGLDPGATAETLWSLFFPQGVGIRGHEGEREAELRSRRTVRIEQPNPEPISDPAREVLFTSNVLLTIPAASRPLASPAYPPDLVADVAAAAAEPQRQWFDHPVQIGVEPAGNEILYGLRALDAALAFEDARRSGREPIGIVPCVLSVTVTHEGLHGVARPYVEVELGRSGDLRHLSVHVFTESDTERLIADVLAPAAGTDDAADLLRTVFGVDGAYGRHYSFLKAIAALWHVIVDTKIRGTFKIDLDQVFPQAQLVAETGRSAFEHLARPSWGAVGADASGRPVELGMIAGALVNERDAADGLFTPDVTYPDGPPVMDEHVFFSRLPQALSTRAEMLERHDSEVRDGVGTSLERIHVTGGTNGILVDALRRHRPFTPSYIGRAEDQAYVISVLGRRRHRLAYAHAAGLFMRHDKEAFAGEAVAAAHVGKQIGDYVRILDFSAYASAVAEDGSDGQEGSLDLTGIQDLLDPFTGCFVSRLPISVTLLRFALRLARLHREGEIAMAREFAFVGAGRLAEALGRARDRTRLRDAIERERRGWDVFYDALDTLEAGTRRGDPRSLALRERGRAIVAGCRIAAGSATP